MGSGRRDGPQLRSQSGETRGFVMATNQQGTVVGVFREHDDARKAVQALKDAGFTEAQIGVVSSNRTSRRAGDDEADESYAPEGAVTGAAAGAGLGALWG